MTRPPDAGQYSPPHTAPAGNALRLREPADVLGAIPFLLGYHPEDSLVALGLSGRRYAFAARTDPPALGAPAPPLHDQVEYLTGVMLRQSVDGVLLVGYGSDARVRTLTD